VHWRCRLDETELVERAKAGDLDAFERLVVLHQRAALQVAYVIAGPEAEDAAQEAFVKAFRALGGFRSGSPFRPWLLRIVANEARNQRRGATRRAGLALRLAERPSGVERSPEEAALGAISRAELVRAVSGLPERDRLTLAYRYFVGLSEAEMATAMSCRPGTVKSRLARALGRLRQALPDQTAARSSEATYG
jgi:RNA polymerase sigma-70 factor (ECF subfamily)